MGLDGLDLNGALIARIEQVQARFAESSNEYGKLDELASLIEEGHLGGKPFRAQVGDVSLILVRRDGEAPAQDKVKAFLDALSLTEAPEFDEGEVPAVDRKARGVERRAEDAITPLVPGREGLGKTLWRDVNVEVVKIAHAFAGTEVGDQMRALRKKSHRRQIGQQDEEIVIGDDVLELWDDDDDAEALAKLARFVKDVQDHNPDRFKSIPVAPVAVSSNEIPPLFWRDVLSGLDGLVTAYPDDDFSALEGLREMMEKGEIGVDEHLYIQVGSVQLWIKTVDDAEAMKQKIAVFIGELKQIASMGSADETSKEPPLDPAMEATYWRDIEGALVSLDGTFGDNRDFKILKMSVERGILGTTRRFKAIIGGVPLDISPSDTDTQMKDKVTEFIRKLHKSGEIQIDAETRKKYTRMEEDYRQVETQNNDLRTRIREDRDVWEGQIRKLRNDQSDYEDEIRRLNDRINQLQARSTPQPRTVRTYSG
jgi:hypothetical protein